MSEDRRLRPPERYESLLETLTKEGAFETKQAAMMFAAALGYYLSKKDQLGKAGEGIRWQVFDRSQDTPFIYALALAIDGSISILNPEDSRLATLFEEYTAGGLQHLQDSLLSKPGDLLDNLLLLLAEARQRHSPAPPGLEGLTPADLDLLGGL